MTCEARLCATELFCVAVSVRAEIFHLCCSISEAVTEDAIALLPPQRAAVALSRCHGVAAFPLTVRYSRCLLQNIEIDDKFCCVLGGA
jgi:hypothetical protein